jgi:hypothetical protein
MNILPGGSGFQTLGNTAACGRFELQIFIKVKSFCFLSTIEFCG